MSTQTKRLHKNDHELWFVVRAITRRTAVLHGLELRAVKPMRRRDTPKYRGLCDPECGVVWLCLRTRVKGKWDTRRDIRYEIFQTIAHELAHLKHGDHGLEWFRFYSQLLSAMVAAGEFERFCKAYGKVTD